MMQGLKNLTHEQTLNLSLLIGKLLLENGAETSRVEDNMFRFCYYFGLKNVDVFVTPTFIILGEGSGVGQNLMCRINSRRINLKVLSQMNDFTYNLNSWPLDYEETVKYLKNITAPIYGKGCTCLFTAFGAAFFTLILNGIIFDIIAAFIVTFISVYFIKSLSNGRYGSFWENFLIGLSIGIFSALSLFLCRRCNMINITVGSLMPFLPGLAFTNGLRDFIAGDLISGNCRVSEAIMLALSLAVGLSISLIAVHRFSVFFGV